jgi:tRNA (cytidine32/uridine32-2'-O)-methyltransferase
MSHPVRENDLLARLRVVLVEPSHPGNIGAVARAMKNMGLSRLALVNPHRFPHPEAMARASGADDILASAELYTTLPEALAGATRIYGTSARHQRTIPWPIVTPRGAASAIFASTSVAETALLFGRESVGLSNEELEQCHTLINIPANPDYSSLNLAQAVQIISYELRLAALELAASPTVSARVIDEAATAAEVNGYLDHLQRLLIQVGFLDPHNPRLLLRRLSRLYQRAALERTEVHILRGILTEVQKRLGFPHG